MQTNPYETISSLSFEKQLKKIGIFRTLYFHRHHLFPPHHLFHTSIGFIKYTTLLGILFYGIFSLLKLPILINYFISGVAGLFLGISGAAQAYSHQQMKTDGKLNIMLTRLVTACSNAEDRENTEENALTIQLRVLKNSFALIQQGADPSLVHLPDHQSYANLLKQYKDQARILGLSDLKSEFTELENKYINYKKNTMG